MKASELKAKLQANGIAHDFSLHPSRVVCNNCGAEYDYGHPNLFTILDYTTNEQLWCPECGPNAENLP